MRRSLRYLLTGCLVLLIAHATWAAHTRNVVLIVSDGVRWQEIFSGADPQLMNDQAGGSWTPIPELRNKYWADDAQQRRRLLFPFLWGTVAKDGQLFGNQWIGSKAYVTNAMWHIPGTTRWQVGSTIRRSRATPSGRIRT